jgi:hypothetical protein
MSLGKWSDNIKAFWAGANGEEYIAHKGSNQIFVYPCGDYPNMPSKVIQHTKRMETVEDFEDGLENGIRYEVTYKRI